MTGTREGYGSLRDMTERELDDLVRSCDSEKLRELHAEAAEDPGTEWHRLLHAQLAVRGAVTCKGCEELFTPAAICPDGYHFDCCDGLEHGHDEWLQQRNDTDAETAADEGRDPHASQ